MKAKLNFSYDEANDVLTVEGIRYSGDLFREYGFSPVPGRWFRVTSRGDGVVVMNFKKEVTK